MARRPKIHDAELDELLKAQGGPVDRHLAKRAQVALDHAQRIVPVDTGRLKKSLKHERMVGEDGSIVHMVGSDVYYSEVVELGDPGNPNYPVQPYLRPALVIAMGDI